VRLETERLILRPFEPRDLEPYAAINADAETMRFFEKPLTREDTAAWIERANGALARTGIHFVTAELKSTGTCVGMIGLSRFDDETRAAIPGRPEVEVGWRLARDVWGQGLAPEGARACLNHAFDILDLDEVVAITAAPNRPSRRVMEKLGMRYDPDGDFDHPSVTEGHPLRRHVLYRIASPRRRSA